MTYAPHPHSIAAKIIKWMQLQDRSQEFSTTVIADALGIEGANIAGSLQAALLHGVVVKETRPNPEGMRLTFWKLGDGTPAALPEDYEPDEPLSRPVSLGEVLRQKLMNSPAKTDPVALAEEPKKRKVFVVRAKQPAEPEPIVQVAPSTFCVGLTLEGQLLIKDGESEKLYDEKQARLIFNVCASRFE